MGLQHCQVMRGRRGRGSHTHPDPLQARTCALIDLRGIYWYLSLLRRHLRASGARISITHTFQSVSFVSWWHDVWNATFFFGRLLGVVIREQGEICRRRKLLNRISHRSFVGTHTQKRWHTHRSDVKWRTQLRVCTTKPKQLCTHIWTSQQISGVGARVPRIT